MAKAEAMLAPYVYNTLILPKKAPKFPKISRGISLKKAGHIASPLHYVYPLIETNPFKGGKEDVHYVPNQSYQRFEQLWIPNQ